MSRITVTFQPDPDVQSMMDRATTAPSGRYVRGLRSHYINEALRVWLHGQGFSRKREQSIFLPASMGLNPTPGGESHPILNASNIVRKRSVKKAKQPKIQS